MYNKQTHIHFVGIGGIGMSGIAKILTAQGYRISGCDTDLEQKSVRDLAALGCTIHAGNNTPQCNDDTIDVLVYSSAINNTNAEIQRARARGIPTIPRALMLAELMRTKYSIAIAGAHGKTTTTSLISHILLEAHYDPTVVIGGHLKSISTNAHCGKGDFLVAEADESDRSLTRLYPTIAVVTNIDLEHLDVYKDLDDIKQTFKQFLGNLPFYGKAIVCHDDPHTMSLLPLTNTQAITYGLTPGSDLQGHVLDLLPESSSFTVSYQQEQLGKVTINMPGIHNMANALAAIAVTRELGVPFAAIAAGLASFKGVDRRFTYKGTYNGALLIDDYGHHPTEIHHTLTIARKRAGNKLIVVFQPHRYSRTFHLWNDFIRTFGAHQIDELIITDIYPASEQPIEAVTSKRLVDEIKKQVPGLSVTYIPLDEKLAGIKDAIVELAQPDDLILLLGAGKVNKLADYLV